MTELFNPTSLTVPKGYYRRIGSRTGRMLGPLPIAISNARVLIGPDHLVLIDGGLVMERYHRIYFKDIQAISVRRTITRVLSLGWLLFLAPLAGILAIFVQHEPVSIFLVLIASLCLMLGFVGWFRGPTCACCVQTAVQSLRLFPIDRIKHADELIRSIDGVRTQQASDS